MTKKITKQQLEQIITEEIKGVLTTEGWVSSMSDKIRSIYRNVGELPTSNQSSTDKITSDPAQPKIDGKRILVLAGQFLASFEKDIFQNKYFRETPIAKKIYNLEEGLFSFIDPQKASTKELEQAVANGTLTIPEIVSSFQNMAKDPQLKELIKSLSDDAEKVFALDIVAATGDQRATEREKRPRTPTNPGDLLGAEIGSNFFVSFRTMMQKENIKISDNNLIKILEFLSGNGLLYRPPSSYAVSEGKQLKKIFQDVYPEKKFKELITLPVVRNMYMEIAKQVGIEPAIVFKVLATLIKYGKLAHPVSKNFEEPEDTVPDTTMTPQKNPRRRGPKMGPEIPQPK